MLCLSLLIVFVGNSSLNVAIPTLSRELARHRRRSCSGSSPSYSLVFAGLLFSTGAHRRPLRPQGRAAARPRRLPRRAALAATLSTAMWQLIALPGADGRRRRVHHAVDAVDPRQRLPARRAHEGDRHLGRRHRRGRRHRPGRERLAARPLLVRLGVPRQRADHRSSRSSSAASSCPKSQGPRAGQARSGRRGAVDRRHLVARLRPHRGARQRLGEPGDARSRSPSASSCSPLFVVLGAARRRADARHALLPATRRSAPAPAA